MFGHYSIMIYTGAMSLSTTPLPEDVLQEACRLSHLVLCNGLGVVDPSLEQLRQVCQEAVAGGRQAGVEAMVEKQHVYQAIVDHHRLLGG